MRKTGRTLTKEEAARLARITQRLAKNQGAFLDHLNHVTAQANSHNVTLPIPHKVVYPTIT